MIVKILEVDGKENYFQLGKKKLNQYMLGCSFVTPSINVSSDELNYSSEGVWYISNDIKYIVKDGSSWRNLSYGYVVGPDKYNGIIDSDRGREHRSLILEDLSCAFKDWLRSEDRVDNKSCVRERNLMVISFTYRDKCYELNLCTVNNLVSKNTWKKQNNEKYFPFDPNMDKYNSYYFFARCRETAEQFTLWNVFNKKKNLLEPEELVDDIINEVIEILRSDPFTNIPQYRFHKL